MGGLMAHMEQDITTMPGHARPPAAFQVTFLTKKGGRFQERIEAAKRDNPLADLRAEK